MEEDQQVMLGSDDEANGGAKEKHEMPKFANREPNVAWLVKTNIFFELTMPNKAIIINSINLNAHQI